MSRGTGRLTIAELVAHIEPFDPALVLARVEGDRVLMAEMIAIFRGEHPGMVGRLRSSVEHGDWPGVQHAAHAIRGAVGNFGGRAAGEAAAELEVMGRDADLVRAAATVERLAHEIRELMTNLERMGLHVGPS